jgi:hypothetical protein
MIFKLKRLRKAAIPIFLSFLSPLTAQTVQLMPLQAGNEYFFMDQLWEVTLLNTTPNPIAGTLEIRIEQANTTAIFTATTAPMTLARGTQRLSNAVRASMSRSYASTPLATSLRQTGKLPFGQYNLCYTFRDALGLTLGVWCQEKTIRPLSPPELISPMNSSTIETTQPILMWRAPFPLQADALRYSVRLAEVPTGMNPAEALRTRPPLLNLTNQRDPFLPYPLNATPLDTNKTYIWQVSAFSGGFDLGVTDMWTFRIVPPIPDSLKKIYLSYCWVKDYEDGSYCHPVDSLKFIYDNVDSDTLLHYTIIDAKNDTLQTALPTIRIQIGMNPIILPIDDLGNLLYNRSYRLFITRKNGKRLSLEFRRRRA